MQIKKQLNGIKSIIEKEKIDCDYSVQDAYVYATTEEDLKEIHKEIKSVKELDFPCEFVSELPLPIQNLGAIKFPNQGQFNPKKYAIKLCDIITQKGIYIFENSVVTDVENDNDVTNMYLSF